MTEFLLLQALAQRPGFVKSREWMKENTPDVIFLVLGQSLEQLLNIQEPIDLLGHFVDQFQTGGLLFPFFKKLGILQGDDGVVGDGREQFKMARRKAHGRINAQNHHAK